MVINILRRAIFAAFALLIAGLSTASATAQTPYGPRLVSLSVVDRDTGEVKRVWQHDNRYFVAGRMGHRYSLRVENQTDRRVEVVLSVDGIDIINGRTAGFRNRGYILAPWQSADITGWRKNESEVAVFRFSPQSQSYASRTGRPDNVGVIGMAVFRERYLPPRPVPMPYPMPPVYRDREMSPQGGVMESRAEGQARQTMPKMQDKLGTAHGEREYSDSPLTTFVRATNTPESVRAVEYDSYENLAAAGIIPAPRYYPPRPQPFPRNPGGGYVPDPPRQGW